MADKHKIKVTTQDRLLRAWEDSMELVRDFELNSHEIADNSEVAQFFRIRACARTSASNSVNCLKNTRAERTYKDK